MHAASAQDLGARRHAGRCTPHNAGVMPIPDQLLFLPGASGNTAFWQPVAQLLPQPAARRHFGWPGFGTTPAEAGVRSLNDLVDRVEAEISVPTALIAQSMGGIVAVRAALRRPHRVTHLVLAATSGGVDVAGRGGEDWRPAFAQANPSLPRWFLDDRSDITDDLRRLRAPALLLWGDADPISPVAVGRHLASLLPDARLHLVAGGDHDLAHARAAEVAPLICRHLALA